MIKRLQSPVPFSNLEANIAGSSTKTRWSKTREKQESIHSTPLQSASISLLCNIISMPFTVRLLLRIATLASVLQLLPLLPLLAAAADSLCPDSCGTIPIHYPFGLRDGCGARQYRNMLNCTNTIATLNTGTSSAQLFFQTPSGSYVVRSIDYSEHAVLVYDPLMSTCSGGGGGGNNIIPRPSREFILSDAQYMTIVPSPDTFFALLNCSSDSPVLHRLSRVCTNSLSGHPCDELYNCPSFQSLRGGAPTSSINSYANFSTGNVCTTTTTSPPSSSSSSASPGCCFTRYDTLKYMTMEILDCTHYVFVYGADKVRGIAPADWSFGIKLSYDLPDSGCELCAKSSGTCGFDEETGGALCICSPTLNSTTTCGSGGDFSSNGGESHAPLRASVLALGAILYMLIR